ncbi:hypothetical protein GIB67_009963 [Kingdonia uniflora]|uniref:Uncharacterized protein n=1 Tax=Kingdonia uniflora TaxID=39325 RepID=A0A7J7L996_9MAGN|nr:hypothetical protein GIB67_009963 [Kingdonia uniflora]
MDGIRAEKVVVLDSIQGRNFRGKLPPDETLGFKLETNEQRLVGSVVRGLDYFTSGSVVDGLGAAILARCQMRKSLGTLCVTWPEFGGSAMLMVKSVLREVLPEVEFGGGLLGFDRIRDPLFESDLYT